MTETVNSNVITKLYQLAVGQNSLDAVSDVVGYIYVATTYEDYISALRTRFPDLIIQPGTTYATIEDPVVLSALLAANIGDGTGITRSDLSVITNSNLSSIFTQNVCQQIQTFNEFQYFGSVTTIPQNMFLNCTDLEQITLPSSCATLNTNSFKGCSQLDSIDLSNVTFLGGGSFESTGLTSADISNVSTLKGSVFKNCTSLQSVTFPSNITASYLSDAGNLFDGCSNLTTVTNLDFSSLSKIPDFLFQNCSNLEINNLSCANLTTLGRFSFYGTKLKKVSDLGSITELSAAAFQNCTSLTEATLPNTITTIRGGAFNGCTNLTTCNMPSSVTTIEGQCFNECRNLNTTFDLSNVTSDGNGQKQFYDCEKLVISNFPRSSSYGAQSFAGIANTSIIIPNTVTSIANACFSNCHNLQTVAFESNSSLTTLVGNCFKGCNNLSSITIPEGVTTIGDGTFGDCSSLTTIDLPSTVQTIGNIAFGYCPLTSLTVRATTPPTLSGTPFFHIGSNCTIYVPSGSVSAYQTAWTSQASMIQAIPS